VRRGGWDPLLLVLAGVLLQYVWRVQEVFQILGKVQFTAVVSVGAVILFLLDGHPARQLGHLRHGLFRLMLAILMLAILSIPTSLRDGASTQFITGNFAKTIVLTAIVAAAIRGRGDLERLLRVFVLGGAGYVVTALLFGRTWSSRLGGVGSYDPNDLGLFTVCTIPLCVYLLRRGAGRLERLAGIGAVMLLFIGTVQSGSRGGFLALIVIGVYGLLGLDAIRRSKRLAVTVVAAALLVVAGGDQYWQRMQTILHPQEDYNWLGHSESGRIEVWMRGLGYMVRHPVLGVGIDQFNAAEGTMAPQAARQDLGIGFKWSGPHSSYVQIGAELGVMGLVLFLALLWRAFREARRIGRTAAAPGDRLLGQAFGGMVVGYVVGGAFLGQAYAPYLYFSLGLLIGLSRVVARDAAITPLVGRAAYDAGHVRERGGAGRRLGA
jgi:O-antigen ligase